MDKLKSLDGYYLFKIKKDNKEVFLGNFSNYKEDIDTLIDTLSDFKFDSTILIFGIDSASYLNELTNILLPQNKVFIFEPNEEIYNNHLNLKLSSNIKLIFYDVKKIKDNLHSIINTKNFDNLYVHAFGGYKSIYKTEYENFIENIDSLYYNMLGNIALNTSSKNEFLVNCIENLSLISNSTPLNSYINSNKNVPAIIVSAGPSLDLNIQDMLANIDKVKKCFVIANNRTFSTLLKNGIRPDLIVCIDPDDAMYDMMKDNLSEDIPILYYEYTNSLLLKHYKGEKIYFSNLLSNIRPELRSLADLPQGGSVAHICVAAACYFACNPIIFTGQDLAYTFDKHHSENASFDIDDSLNNNKNFLNTIDVYGKGIKTTRTLLNFKENMEYYIKKFNEIRKTDFINCSYGADILGAPFEELKNVLDLDILNYKKQNLLPDKSIIFDYKSVYTSILDFISTYIKKSEQGIEQCTILTNFKKEKSLVDIDKNDIDFQRFLFVMDLVSSFENSLESMYISGYFNNFIFFIKRESFSMSAKDYKKLTSNMNYQASCFLNYFKKMNEMLVDAKKIILSKVTIID